MGLPLREFVCLCALVFGAIGSAAGLNWTVNRYDCFVMGVGIGCRMSGGEERSEASVASVIACWDFELAYGRPRLPAPRDTVAVGESLPSPDLL